MVLDDRKLLACLTCSSWRFLGQLWEYIALCAAFKTCHSLGSTRLSNLSSLLMGDLQPESSVPPALFPGDAFRWAQFCIEHLFLNYHRFAPSIIKSINFYNQNCLMVPSNTTQSFPMPFWATIPYKEQGCLLMSSTCFLAIMLMQLFQIPPTALFGLRHQEATMQRNPEQGLPVHDLFVSYLRQSGNLKIKTKNVALF